MKKASAVLTLVALVALLCMLSGCSGSSSVKPDDALILIKDQPQQPKKAEAPARQIKPKVDDNAQAPEAPKAEPAAETAEVTDAEDANDEEPAEAKGKLVGGIVAKGDIIIDSNLSERERVAELYMRAQQYHQNGDFTAAKALLKRVKRDQPYYEMIQRMIVMIDADIEKAEQQEAVRKEDAQFRQGKAQRLYRDAQRAYNAKRYSEAVELIEEAYKLDPKNTKIRDLRADALIARGGAEMRHNSLNQDARIAEVMSQVEKMGTVPKELPRVSRPIIQETPNPDAEVERQLEEKLNQRIPIINLEAVPLDYLLNLLFRATGVNIIAKPEDLEGKTLTLHVEDIKLIDLLDYISKTLGVSFTRSRNAIWLQGGGDVQAGPLMQWRVIPLNKGLIDVQSDDPANSNIEKLLAEVPNLITWPQDSQYYLDRKTNSLFVKTTSEAMLELVELVKAVDVTPIQVLIETKFIEITDKDFNDFGIDWKLTSDFALSKKGGQNKLQIDSGMGVSLPAPVNPGADFPANAGFDAILAGVMTVPQFQATLHALRATGHTSTLGEPRLIAVNNSTAELEITKDLYYVSDYEIDRQDWNGSSFVNNTDQLLPGVGSSTDLDFAEPIIVPKYTKTDPIGFKLKVTPSVGKDMKDITLYLQPEITDLVEMLKTQIAASNITFGGQPLSVEQPIISKRKITAKLTVSDGYVVVLGGLVRQTKEKGMVKVPILGDIPILGMLFRRQNEKNIKTNLLIFVSAKILTSEGRMYTTAGPGNLDLGGGYADEPNVSRARELRDQVEVQVER